MGDTKIEVATQIGWRTLLGTVGDFVERCEVGELATGDAEKLEALARAIRLRLMELSRGKTCCPPPSVHISPFSARPDMRTLNEVFRVPREQRTRRDVLRLRDEAAVYGGCCDRFADMMGCDCLERAREG